MEEWGRDERGMERARGGMRKRISVDGDRVG
jgi:hypothetical protein